MHGVSTADDIHFVSSTPILSWTPQHRQLPLRPLLIGNLHSRKKPHAAPTPSERTGATAEPSTAPVETGQKRRREEELATPVAQPSPPKKVKTN